MEQIVNGAPVKGNKQEKDSDYEDEGVIVDYQELYKKMIFDFKKIEIIGIIFFFSDEIPAYEHEIIFNLKFKIF